MGQSFESAVTSYLKARSLSPATGVEYQSTLSKWNEWGKNVPLECIGRADVREFLDWVHERAIDNEERIPDELPTSAASILELCCHGLGKKNL